MDSVKLADTMLFLSTLSLRRATISARRGASESIDFYPRSPCGERLSVAALCQALSAISIHALLAESDVSSKFLSRLFLKFLSTLSLRRATVVGDVMGKALAISIHALLAESDA